ncbi:MAG TPA: hypothetical protein PKZ26_01550 [Anaerolineaceae bacterium]|jgi:hypothetical protein|nr:hypothetical protein [Anaerolineaceae bacterium]HOS53145.1 hypothetical protein [Anaerolineaceae bacterium]HPD62915.1 hypothetical protein [Anaerolineaceae bacterium]HQF69108.1 hypothetical protein [Anaerolineaceae bacterium]HQK04954.1 hypothetical protein [Anaerolineaceae bacterium]
MKALRITLLVFTIYTAIIGILFLFAPRIAETAFQTRLPDAALTMLYGQVVLVLALAAWLIRSDAAALRKMVWALVFAEVGHVVVFLWQLMNGISTFAQVGPPMIIAAVFAVLFVVFNRKG